jgi:hypothetical protein
MKNDQSVTLSVDWRPSSAYRERVGLSLLNLSVGQVPVDLLASEQTGPAILARNPRVLLPQMYNARRWAACLGAMSACEAIDAHLRTIPTFMQAAPAGA